MALVDSSGKLVAQYINRQTLIIANPGGDEEEVLHRIPMGPLPAFNEGLEKLRLDSRLSEKDRFMAGFWAGYFYAHDVRGT